MTTLRASEIITDWGTNRDHNGPWHDITVEQAAQYMSGFSIREYLDLKKYGHVFGDWGGYSISGDWTQELEDAINTIHEENGWNTIPKDKI